MAAIPAPTTATTAPGPRSHGEGARIAGPSTVAARLGEIRRELATLPLDRVPVGRASEVMEDLAGIERLVGAARVRIGHRVAQSGLHKASGDRDAAGFCSRLSGSSVGRARAELDLAQRLERLPEVASAYRDGRLTTEQAQVVAQAAAADPEATGALLETAARGTFGELQRQAARAERAALREEDEVARERRLRERRSCRTWTPPEGGLRIDAHLPSIEGAQLFAALTAKTNELMAGSEDTVEHLRADALVALVCGPGARTELLVRADAAALVRGERDGDEICEVDGVGPISVTAARSLLGGGFLTLLVQRGADIATVTSTTRVVPAKVEKALRLRDPVCVVPGCTASIGLEIDHWRLDFGKGGLTALDNLCRLCSVHHKMKTDGTLVLEGGPGRWTATTPRRWWPGCRAGPRAGP